MKNIQAQYQDLLEGKMSKANFMRNVRMQFPQYVSSTTSYNDSVNILKGKRILSENFSSPGLGASIDEKMMSTKNIAFAIVHELSDSYTKEDVKEAVNDYLVDSAVNSVVAAKYTKNQEWWNELYKQVKEAKEYLSSPLNEAKKPEGVYGHNPNAEMDEYRRIDHLNYYQVYRGLQFELAKMGEITDENYIKARKKVVDKILKDPDAYKDLQLANFRAVKDMDKDLEMKEVKKNNLNDKPNGMKVVKKDVKGNTQDNLGKKEAKKSKTAKVPVMTQNPKGKLEAFATPGKEKVMALKEHILDEMTNLNPSFEEIRKGSRVKKKDDSKTGTVEEYDGHIAEVKWDDGTTEGITKNVLTTKDVPPQVNEDPVGQETAENPEAERGMKDALITKKERIEALKEKLVKELGFVTKNKKGVVVGSGKNTAQGITAAKGLETTTGQQLTVTDLETGRETQV